MKIRLLNLIGATLLSISSFAQISYNWANKIANNPYYAPIKTGVITELDENNALYTVGQFNNTLTIENKTVTGDVNDGFIAKYNLSGQIQWLKAIKHTTHGAVNINAIDYFSNGDIVICGSFDRGTINLGSGLTLSTYSQTGPQAGEPATGFVACYSTYGTTIWAKKIDATAGMPVAIECTSIAVDRISNNAYVVGNGAAIGSTNTMRFFGSSIYTMPLVVSNHNLFIGKFNIAGSALGFKRMYGGSTDTFDNSVTAIKIDNNQNPVVVGSFESKKLYLNASGSIYLTNRKPGTKDLFLIKFDKTLTNQPLWSKSFGGIYDDLASDVAVTTANDIFVTGTYDRQTKFSSTVLNGGRLDNGFLLKCNSQGAFALVKNFASASSSAGGGSYDYCDTKSLTFEKVNGQDTKVYVVSTIQGSVKVANSATTINSEAENILVTKFSIEGTLISNKTIGGNAATEAKKFMITSDNSAYLLGNYVGSDLTLGNITLTATANANGMENNSGFVCRLNSSSLRLSSHAEEEAIVQTEETITADKGQINSANIVTLKNELNVYPNPTNGILNINTTNAEIQTAEVIDIKGSIVKTDSAIENNSIDLSDLENGTYLVRVITSTNEQLMKRIQIIK